MKNIKKRVQWGVLIAVTLVLGVTLNVVTRKRHERIRQLATMSLLRESISPRFALSRLRTLLQQDADVNGHDDYGNTPLTLLAATCLDTESGEKTSLMQCLLEHGANPNAQNVDGDTPLIIETNSYESPNLPLLLSNGANPNVRNKKGDMPLFITEESADFANANVLLSKGADPNARNKMNQTPLALIMVKSTDHDMEQSERRVNLTFMRLLVSCGANPNKQTGDGTTALMAAARNGDLSSAKLFLSKGCHVDTRDRSGYTALCYAARNDNLEAFKFLISKRAGIQAGRGGVGALLMSVLASYDGSTESMSCARFLLDRGADPNYYEYAGSLTPATPLMEAASKGDVESLRLLLKRGAHVNTKLPQDDYGIMTALEFAQRKLRGVQGDLQSIGMLGGVLQNPEDHVISATQESRNELWKAYLQGQKIEKLLLQAGAKKFSSASSPGI